MIELFENMGLIRWPMLVAGLFLIAQIGRAAARVRDPGPGAARSRHAILVWGGLSALVGLLGTVLGLAVAARVVAAAGSAEPSLLATGIQVALASSILGLVLLVIAVVAWLVLQSVQRHVPDDPQA